jgi:hypothetical protein
MERGYSFGVARHLAGVNLDLPGGVPIDTISPKTQAVNRPIGGFALEGIPMRINRVSVKLEVALHPGFLTLLPI